MSSDQKFRRLRSRMTLLRRHNQEWAALLLQQRQVRLFMKQPVVHQLRLPIENRLATVELLMDQGYRFSEVIKRQTLERGQMRSRHQQEVKALKQIIDAQTSNEDTARIY